RVEPEVAGAGREQALEAARPGSRVEDQGAVGGGEHLRETKTEAARPGQTLHRVVHGRDGDDSLKRPCDEARRSRGVSRRGEQEVRRALEQRVRASTAVARDAVGGNGA